jgi:transcriptional regulator with PAS, ATPase and Fis domain
VAVEALSATLGPSQGGTALALPTGEPREEDTVKEALRTVLWIGKAAGLEASPMAECPEVDLVWTPALDDALTLALPDFHTVVMDAPERGRRASVGQLLRAGARRVLVTTEPAHYPGLGDLGDAHAAPPAALANVIGASDAMQAAFALVGRAQRTPATVLLTGETGTGKEVLARSIHTGSRRGGGPFVALNCAAFPDTLLESELFGHVRGSFTGADRAKVGLFEEAHEGTLFLDEIGETSPFLQVKLLRALQEREVRPVGGTRTRKIDVRVIAATHRDLRRAIRDGDFREDLYYRLAVFPLPVPPLRERRADILPLTEHFIALHGKAEQRGDCHFDEEASRLLVAYAWPGNVRELENEVQRALALSEPGEVMPAEILSPHLREGLAGVALEPERLEGETLHESLARAEAWLLRRALDRHEGRRAATARALGITREGLYKKMKRLGIE